ncbi:hypothetical protein LEN26_006533 [Aphanomyces euteiches]|nr:hypothetical protein AeMF1_007098 [Aphanomyces euteiches]KAH9120989.1 hypothetical protein AeMF1_007091 [Aphanomyces euteiches]KAH9135166.1 hypothetical protein LEN26_006533 [Aphanomyces euteiches]KAH9191626.1 hypothetical protein AeNC1_006402 [Aphanomyces euteiches]
MVDKSNHLYIFYGSQTGCAESIAKRVQSDAQERHISADLFTLNEFEKSGVLTQPQAKVFIVCSTTGNGDPPTNAEKFWRFLKKKAHPATLLQHITYTVLALGDTNYDKFCYMGKNINRRMGELGATGFFEIGCADEAMGLEDYVEPWMKGFWDVMTTPKDVKPTVESTEEPTVESAVVPTKTSKLDHLHIFYGSQTGCAESIAKRIQSDALERKLTCDLRPLNEFEKCGILSLPSANVFIVCSTTGNGDPPNNAEKFWRFLKKKVHPATLLQNLRFTVLALGDTNYDKFCYMGKNIHRRMKELGAECVYELGCADEAMGLEDSVEPWVLGFWEFVGGARAESAESNANNTAGTVSEVENIQVASVNQSLTVLAYLTAFNVMFPEGAPAVDPSRLPRFQDASVIVAFDLTSVPPRLTTPGFMATIINAKYLTTEASDRKVLWLELDTTGAGITYVPGDSIGVRCPNDADVVDYLVQRLNIQKDQLHSSCVVQGSKKSNAAPLQASLLDLLTHHYDLYALVKKATLRSLAQYCTDATEQAQLLYLSSKDGPAAFQKFVEAQRLSLLEVLALFPSCQPSLELVLSLLPTLSPRYYSIASSPLNHANRVQIAFTLVEYNLTLDNGANIPRRGLCTNWLHRLALPLLTPTTANTTDKIQIPIFHHPTKDFVLPADPKWPLILIGPGTGVAPFVGYLQHRMLEKAKHADESESSGYWRGGFEVEDAETNYELGPIHLYFGCRNRAHDFLFESDLRKYVDKAILTRLHVAASREQDTKHYVQHDIAKHGVDVYDLIVNQGGFVYVCGDGMNMAKDVHEALVQVFLEHGNATRDAALEQLKDLAFRRRYVKDIWG